MKYYHSPDDLADAARHLRNKNLALLPRKRGLIDSVIDRLTLALNRARELAFARRGFKLVVSEQIVEYPMVLRNLRPDDRSVLDFGGYESVLPLQLSALGYQVTVLDQRRYPFQHPNLTVVCRDLFDPAFSMERQYDLVLSISTVEHLGLGGYNDIRQANADRRGVERLWGLVRPGGRLMVSVPAGRPAVQRSYRVYNQQRIDEVFPAGAVVHWFCKDGREGVWALSSAVAVGELIYDEPDGTMPAQAVAFIICTKAPGPQHDPS